MASSVSPPFEQLSPTNRGPILSVFIFICLTTTCIIVLAKLLSAFYFRQRQSDVNAPIWVALMLALVQSILMQYAVDRGLGRHRASLSPPYLDQYHKLVYCAEFLLVSVLALSKLSTTLLIQKLSPKKNIRNASWITLGVIGVWTAFAILGDALQCGLPNPWVCPGQRPVQYVIGILNIVTDVALVAIPVFMLQDVQMPPGKRLRIEAAFALRLCVPAATIVQMVFLRSYIDSKDYTWNIVNTAVCKQFMMNVSIIAACTPTLYHVLSSFSAGFAGLHIPENLELSVNRSKHTRSQTKSGGSAGNGGILSTSNKIDDYPRHVQGPFDEGYGMSYGHQAEVRASRDGAGSTESTRGLTRSESLGVVKTVDIWVDVERQDRSD